jgi:ABC-type transport system involved in multi-copper enzyme maturation permease subunit
MINLILSEIKKVGIIKILLSFIIFLIVIIMIYEFSDDMKNTIFSLIPFVGIMTSILFSGIISGEIETGTFRFYLTKPVSRKKIYQSKLITIMIYTIGLLTFIFYIYKVLCQNIDKEYFVKFVKYSSSLLISNCLIIFFSTMFRNTSVSVAVQQKTSVFF